MAAPLNTRLSPQHDTFFEDATPVDAQRPQLDHEMDAGRDSHDLAFGGNVRNSVVDNMLLSLDQFGTDPAALYTDFFLADHPYQSPSRSARPRGHTYASSASSDYDGPALNDDASSRYSTNPRRGRRSNSSNNIQPVLSRKSSLRAYSSARDTAPASMFGEPLQGGHLRGGGKKSSKGSGSSSMDFGHAGILGTHRLGFGRRSASFDHGHRMTPIKSESILDRGRPTYDAYRDYDDAAPEPTIPAGPRRAQDPPQSPVYRTAPAQSTVQRGARPPANKTLRKNKSQPPENNLRLQAQEFVTAANLRDMPRLPNFQNPPAPAPTVSTRKASGPSPSTPVAAPRDKPGFFRRVFGVGSKNPPAVSQPVNPSTANTSSSPASSHNRDSHLTYPQSRPQTNPGGANHIATQLRSMPSGQLSSQNDSTRPTLAKKHSSFFRRRKKSTSEVPKVPIMALDFRPPQANEHGPGSPSVSSLRQVMNPFLSGGPEEKAREQDDHRYAGEVDRDREQAQGFSPGYKPHADATVRTVKPGSRGTNDTPPSSRDEDSKPRPSSPRLKLKMNVVKRSEADAHHDSFLADSSSCNEERVPSPPREKADKGKSPLMAQTQQISRSTSEIEDEDGWVVTPDAKARRGSPGKARRVWLEPTSSEEKLDQSLLLPLEGAKQAPSPTEKVPGTPTADETPSSADTYHSATSLPVVHIESRESVDMPSLIERSGADDIGFSEADVDRAVKLFFNEDASVRKDQVATILGDMTIAGARVRKAYLSLFDWSNISILAAMRDLCGKLVLKAETQQVDRILMTLSERWCECNPSHGFKSTDVVHTICYSILLLNTDLHVADIESRMTRSQFVKNTLPTVVRVCQESAQDGGEETLRPQSLAAPRRGSIPWNRSEPSSPAAENTAFPTDVTDEPLENRRARSRLSVKPPPRADGQSGPDSAHVESDTLVNNPHTGSLKTWEAQIEVVLKEFYNSIRHQKLPLHGSSNAQQIREQPSTNNLSVGGMLRRTPSMLSKAPSENLSYRGRQQGDFRSMGPRWASKNRSRPRLYPNSTVGSSRTSLDDQSVWSPAGSSTWSRYSFGRGTTMSMESLGSHFATGDYQQAIGFANALSQAIIREEGMSIHSNEEFTRVAPLLEDESLELVGAPWAKEGILKHKHHLEAADKKAKDRTWMECFAVVEKGYMRLFSFNANSKSVRHKGKARPAGSVVGGGNWADKAEALDSFLLRHAIASALPPPGYSKSRPHVWALSLPNGAVHLFQVGTPDIVREFVSTANYWSARLSKEPLTGGVSSMEYGWGESVINPALIRNDSTPSTNSHQQGHVPRPSVTSSIRSSMDHATGTMKPRLPGDKVVLHDWTPPAQSMMASNLMEVDQLRALTDYVKNVEAELARHNELRAPMLIAFSPRHPNAAKAMANWQRKSDYLLREIVKFSTYIDSLTGAQAAKAKIYAEREAEEAQNAENETNGDSAQAQKAQERSSTPEPEAGGRKETAPASASEPKPIAAA